MIADKNLDSQIKDVLEQARSFLLADGGDLSFVKFEDGILYVRLHGACVTCPISELHLKIGVEDLVKQHVKQVKEVRSI